MALAPGTPLAAWYAALFREWGPQRWWPARTRFEVVLGAILTQGVAWSNVERALGALRRAGLMSPGSIRGADRGRLARLIRPAGYFNQKARAIQGFVALLDDGYAGRIDWWLRRPTPALRRELLGLRGIGPETADAILLYAAGRPVFVIDAYTRRVLQRHGAIRGSESYEDLRVGFERALPRRTKMFNEYHALIVRLGKERCRRSKALCSGCPLERWLPAGGPRKLIHPAVRRAAH